MIYWNWLREEKRKEGKEMDKTVRHMVELKGRTVDLFVNQTTGLVVLDVNHKNGKGGNEILRRDAYKVDLAHCEN